MATIGATRPSPDYSRWIHDLCDPGQYGPFVYSREDIREVVEYAASLHITVLPEIEFPAHSREVLMAYPEFFCSDALHLREAITMCNADGAPPKFGAEPALNKSALCVGNDATLAFARHLIDVVCELFPGEYIHIGGDECVKRNWKQCRRCQARMCAEGLKDENELQCATCGRGHSISCARAGRTALLWRRTARSIQRRSSANLSPATSSRNAVATGVTSRPSNWGIGRPVRSY